MNDLSKYTSFSVALSGEREIEILQQAAEFRQREKAKHEDGQGDDWQQLSREDMEILGAERQIQEACQEAFHLPMLPHLAIDPFVWKDDAKVRSPVSGITVQGHKEMIPNLPCVAVEYSASAQEKDANALFPSARNAPVSEATGNMPAFHAEQAPIGCVQSPYPPNNFPRIYHRPQTPTAMELEEELLRLVSLRKIGERIYYWNGSYYHCVNSTELRELILSRLRSSLAIKGSSSQLGEIETLLQSDSRISGAPLDKEATVLNVHNGILNLQNLLLQPQDPAYFFTSVISVPWQPDAACPRFDAFICDVAGGNPKLIHRFWQAIGYILVPDNHAKRFIYLWGAGDSGKSVLGGLLESFFPETLTSGISIFQLGDRFSLSNLVDKRINVSMDLPNRCLNEQAMGTIKMITGGDSILVEEKYKAPYTTHVNCKLIFSSNFPLRLAASDQAFLDRCLELPFCYSVPKGRQNPHLLEALKAERPGILVKAINAYLHLRQNNYIFSLDGQMPSACVEVEAQVSEVPVEEFVPACCEIAPEAVASSEALYTGYCSFCARINRPPMRTQAAFSTALRLFLEQAYPSVTKKKVRIQGTPVQAYCGIRLRTDCA